MAFRIEWHFFQGLISIYRIFHYYPHLRYMLEIKKGLYTYINYATTPIFANRMSEKLILRQIIFPCFAIIGVFLEEMLVIKKYISANPFVLWLALFFLLEIGLAKIGLHIKSKYAWSYNYFLPIIYFILTYFSVKWRLLKRENIITLSLGVVFVLVTKFVYNGLPTQFILNKKFVWQVFPSFFEEIIFRGILLFNFSKIENGFFKQKINFPFVSIIIISIIFGALHPNNFARTFDISIYFSLIFLVTGSYWASGTEHFLQNIYSNLWN